MCFYLVFILHLHQLFTLSRDHINMLEATTLLQNDLSRLLSSYCLKQPVCLLYTTCFRTEFSPSFFNFLYYIHFYNFDNVLLVLILISQPRATLKLLIPLILLILTGLRYYPVSCYRIKSFHIYDKPIQDINFVRGVAR